MFDVPKYSQSVRMATAILSLIVAFLSGCNQSKTKKSGSRAQTFDRRSSEVFDAIELTSERKRHICSQKSLVFMVFNGEKIGARSIWAPGLSTADIAVDQRIVDADHQRFLAAGTLAIASLKKGMQKNICGRWGLANTSTLIVIFDGPELNDSYMERIRFSTEVGRKTQVSTQRLKWNHRDSLIENANSGDRFELDMTKISPIFKKMVLSEEPTQVSYILKTHGYGQPENTGNGLPTNAMLFDPNGPETRIDDGEYTNQNLSNIYFAEWTTPYLQNLCLGSRKNEPRVKRLCRTHYPFSQRRIPENIDLTAATLANLSGGHAISGTGSATGGTGSATGGTGSATGGTGSATGGTGSATGGTGSATGGTGSATGGTGSATGGTGSATGGTGSATGGTGSATGGTGSATGGLNLVSATPYRIEASQGIDVPQGYLQAGAAASYRSSDVRQGIESLTFYGAPGSHEVTMIIADSCAQSEDISSDVVSFQSGSPESLSAQSNAKDKPRIVGAWSENSLYFNAIRYDQVGKRVLAAPYLINHKKLRRHLANHGLDLSPVRDEFSSIQTHEHNARFETGGSH